MAAGPPVGCGMLKYTVELKPGGYTAEELKQSGDGGADALVIVSIVRGGKPAHSGPVSFAVITADSVGYDGGDAPEIPVTELFSAVVMQCNQIAQDEVAPQWQRLIAKFVVDIARIHVTSRPGLIGDYEELLAHYEKLLAPYEELLAHTRGLLPRC
jgi:hypothetical protein